MAKREMAKYNSSFSMFRVPVAAESLQITLHCALGMSLHDNIHYKYCIMVCYYHYGPYGPHEQQADLP